MTERDIKLERNDSRHVINPRDLKVNSNLTDEQAARLIKFWVQEQEVRTQAQERYEITMYLLDIWRTRPPLCTAVEFKKDGYGDVWIYNHVYRRRGCEG